MVYGVALIVAVPLAWTAGRQLIALFIDGVVVVSIGLEAVMHVRGDQGRWSLTIPGGAVIRGTAFYGKVPERRGLYRKARIVVFPLEANTWAQAWTVTQPGMNHVEYEAVDRVLNSIMLMRE